MMNFYKILDELQIFKENLEKEVHEDLLLEVRYKNHEELMEIKRADTRTEIQAVMGYDIHLFRHGYFLIDTHCQQQFLRHMKVIELDRISQRDFLLPFDHLFTHDTVLPYFRNMKFSIDVDSFRSVPHYSHIPRLLHMQKLKTTGLSLIHSHIEALTSAIENHPRKTYSLSDLFCPVRLGEESSEEAMKKYMNLYEIASTERARNVEIMYLPAENLKSIPDRHSSYFQHYTKNFCLAVKEKELMPEPTSVIYMGISQDDKIIVNMNEFYLGALVDLRSTADKALLRMSQEFQQRMTMCYQIDSIIQVVNKLPELPGTSFLNRFSGLLNSDRNAELVEYLAYLVIEDAMNAMKAVNALVIQYRFAKEEHHAAEFVINDQLSVVETKF